MSGAPASARDALAAWLQHLGNERRASPRTLQAYGDAVRRYLDFLERHRGGTLRLKDLGETSAADLRAFLAFRRQGDRPLSPRSVSQALSAIRGFHRFLDRRCGVAGQADRELIEEGAVEHLDALERPQPAGEVDGVGVVHPCDAGEAGLAEQAHVN